MTETESTDADGAGDPRLHRRALLKGAAGAGTAAALGSTAGAAAGQSQVDYGGFFGNTSNFDGSTIDKRGQDTVTVTVGAQGNNGAFAFDPAAVMVSPGTTVRWEWTGEGSGHNVVSDGDGPLDSGELVSEAGVHYEYTFEETGTYTYVCEPHVGLGMKGAVVVREGGGGGGGGSQGTPVSPDYGGWFEGVSNFDGSTADKRGQDTVTVTVGAQGNNGAFAFDPPAVMVSPGTTVRWEWTGEGSGHNVVSDGDGPLDSGELISEAGVHYEYTFEETGTFKYVCEPHAGLGMKGAVVVREGGGGGSQGAPVGPPVNPDFGGFFEGVSNYDGSTTDRTGQSTVTVTVGAQGNNGAFAFDPPAVRVTPGTTVRWEWTGEGSGHNVVSNGDGPLDSGELVSEAGVHYEYTFEQTGIYEYVCEPHAGLGMKGAVVVGGPPGGGDGGQDRGPAVAPGLGVGGSAVLLAFGAPLAYAALKRRRPAAGAPGATAADAEGRAAGDPEATPVTEEAPVTDPSVEIGHDEYDPWGTAALVVAYLAIIGLMWIFMYFVEFLGRVSVVG